MKDEGTTAQGDTDLAVRYTYASTAASTANEFHVFEFKAYVRGTFRTISVALCNPIAAVLSFHSSKSMPHAHSCAERMLTLFL